MIREGCALPVVERLGPQLSHGCRCLGHAAQKGGKITGIGLSLRDRKSPILQKI